MENGKDDFLIRWNSSCFLMYNNLTVIFTFKYVQKVTGNRGILTRHLTISCQIHIYVALQRTNRTATQSSLEEIYVHHRGPSCKQHTTFLQKKHRTFHIALSQSRSDEEEELLLPRKAVGHTGQWLGGGFKDGRARPSFISTLQISLRHITSFSTF